MITNHTRTIGSCKRILAFIAVLGFMVRLVPIIPAPPPLQGDEVGYVALAEHWVQTGKYQIPEIMWAPVQGGKPGDATAFRGPVFPFFLAFHLIAFGPSEFFPRITLILIGAATPCLLLLFTMHTLQSRTAGIIAGLLWAIWPTAFAGGYSASSLYSETLGLFFLSSCFVLVAKLSQTPSVPVSLLSGILLTCAILTRGYFLFIIPFILLWIFQSPIALHIRIRTLIPFGIILSIILGAWVIRNWIMLGSPVFSTQTEHLYLGNNSWARGSMNGDVWSLGIESPQLKAISSKYDDIWNTSEVDRAKIWVTEGQNCIISNIKSPGHFLWLQGRKAILFFSPLIDCPPSWYPYHFSYSCALIFAMGGCYILIREKQWSKLVFICSPILCMFLVCQIAYSHDRMRYPSEPFVVVLASYFIANSIERRKGVTHYSLVRKDGEG